ncbi:MAG TPA: DUF6544 family protein [Vicinamibacterales bacterium]|nr:DUF6544 family protein [Vicinamibacterales bacterium]
MLLLLAILLVFHGFIHLMGVAKAFGLVDLPELTQPITPAVGLLWLAAALLFFSTGTAIFVWPRLWWMLGAAGIVVSTAAIALAWSDARWGTIANLLIGIAVVGGFAWYGPRSLHAEYVDAVAAALADRREAAVVTAADVAHLPDLVRRYLTVTGAIGRPKVTNFRARMHGRIRGAVDEPWMTFSAEQHNFYERRQRLFYMTASRSGLPVQGLHRYADASASMRIRIAGLVPIMKLEGDEMTRTETVTLFNDMCLMAPETLIDPALEWSPIDASTVQATFTNAGHTIRAFLAFAEDGRLVNFWSDDRRRASADGSELLAARWSTPIAEYRSFEGRWLPATGTGRWSAPSTDFAYLEVVIDQVTTNVASVR